MQDWQQIHQDASSRLSGANGLSFRFVQFARARDECELHAAKRSVQTKTDAICGGPAQPSLSGLLQRWSSSLCWRVDVYLESIRHNLALSLTLICCTATFPHPPMSSSVSSRNADSVYGLLPFPNKPGVSAAPQSSEIPKFSRNKCAEKRADSSRFCPPLSFPAALPSPLSRSAQRGG